MTTLMKLVATIFAATLIFAGPASASPSPSHPRIFVGNLSFVTTKEDLVTKFSEYGGVRDVHIVIDPQTGMPRGIAFVTMSTPEETQAAIAALNGKELDGRNLTVNLADERAERSGTRSNPNPRERGGQRFDRRSGGGAVRPPAVPPTVVEPAAVQPAAVPPTAVEPVPSRFLFISGVDPNVLTESDLEAAIAEFGQVHQIEHVETRSDATKSRSIFKVYMTSIEEAKAVIAGLQHWKAEKGISVSFVEVPLVM